MMQKNLGSFPVTGVVEIFPMENPWVYVPVPKKYSKMFAALADRGLIAVDVTLGQSCWPTSLMPKGDGTHFIPLSAKIRKAEGVEVGDKIKLKFSLRQRRRS